MKSIAEKQLSKDVRLKKLIDEYGPCKIQKRRSTYYFEDLVSSIVEQQLSGKAAKTIFTRVKILLTNGELITFKSVLKAKDDKLRGCGMSWSKVSYIKDLAEKVKGGEVDIKNLNKLTDDQIVDELTKVKGIGRWTAEMFLMFTLARPDIFPLDDLGIRKGMDKLFKKKLDRSEMNKLANSWKPYRTTASWYIWRVTDNF